MNNILFVGASGMLGQPVAMELIRAGFTLTLFGRNTEKLEKLFPNIQTVKGDIFDRDSLKNAMTGIDTVYINLSIDQSAGKNAKQPEREGIRNIVDVAKVTGIQRIGFISSLIKNYRGMNNFHWWVFDIKENAVESIKRSGIPYSVFYPSTFMETIDKQMIQGNRLFLVGKSEAPMWFISGKDYGVQVAWAFKKAGNNNQEYPVQGLDPFTFEESARLFISKYKKKLALMKIPLLPIKLAGIINNKIDYAAHICEALNKYPEKFESQKTWNELGKPTITLADYIESLNS